MFKEAYVELQGLGNPLQLLVPIPFKTRFTQTKSAHKVRFLKDGEGNKG